MLSNDARNLREEIKAAGCGNPPLYADAKTPCVSGTGPIPAEIMIVGEAPGAQEDEAGEPFIGSAGKFLTKELQKVGIDREAVFVTNVVKCRPPNNRPPTLKEIKSQRPYFDMELGAVQPKVVLLLGNSALQGVLSTSGIMKKRGAAIKKDDRIYFATYHPSAILRNPTLVSDFRADLEAFKKLIDGESDAPVTNVNIIRGANQFQGFLDQLNVVYRGDPIALDVETCNSSGRKEAGLEPYSADGRLETVSFSWQEGESWVIPLEHPEQDWNGRLPKLYADLSTALQGRNLGGHNVLFDLMWLRSRGVNIEAKWDTILMLHLLNENRPNSLKTLARTFLGADLYEDGIVYTETNPLNLLAEYNGRDTDYTLRLFNIFSERMDEHPKLKKIFRLISIPACNLLADVSMRGWPVDTERLYQRHDEIQVKLIEIEEKLMALVPEELKAKANFRSTQFLQRWLFDYLGLPPVKFSEKTELPSTAETVLLQLAGKHPAINLLLEHRKYTKWYGTYTGNWIEKVERNRKPLLFPDYNITGTVTGRLSGNMQQIPRDNYIRGIIGAPDGYRLVEADFSQIELRLAAMIADEKTMKKAYAEGKDLHMITAVAVSGKPEEEINKEERTIGKSLNFGLLYGMGWRKFKTFAGDNYGVEITERQAQNYRKAFFDRYPALTRWHERQRTAVNNLARVESPIGRVRHLQSIRSEDKGIRSMAERQGINSPIQGLASDFTLLAMPRIEKALDPDKAKMFGQVHDSILVLAKEEYAEEAARIMKEIMETLPIEKLFGFAPSVPIVVDCNISMHLGEHDG